MKYKIIAYKQEFLKIEQPTRTLKKPYFIKQFVIHDIDFKEVEKTTQKLAEKYHELKFDCLREGVSDNSSIYAWHNSKLGKYRKLVGV